MANTQLTETFQDIADAIRDKGVVGTMTPLEMPDKIASITSGGGSGETKYGVGVDGIVGKVDADGVLAPAEFEFSSNDIVSIADNVLENKFQRNSGLTEVNLPNLTSIGMYGMRNAFQYCTSLEKVSLPKITTLGDNAMY